MIQYDDRAARLPDNGDVSRLSHQYVITHWTLLVCVWLGVTLRNPVLNVTLNCECVFCAILKNATRLSALGQTKVKRILETDFEEGSIPLPTWIQLLLTLRHVALSYCLHQLCVDKHTQGGSKFRARGKVRQIWKLSNWSSWARLEERSESH